ncbi:MAG: TonB-dependent siderophore receptor [Candidatus Taylorbacteria bacterium]|nr:TonB-dependent siderophore receptor [Candidatus Taylorbacteria bacterium]
MAKKLSIVFGIVFIIVGILGFIPNPLVSATGFFGVDTVHTIVHLVIGIILLVVGLKCAKTSAAVLIVVGAVYLLLAIIGFFGVTSILGFLNVNTPDNWLHAVLGIVIIIAGIMGKKCNSEMAAPAAPVAPTQM